MRAFKGMHSRFMSFAGVVMTKVGCWSMSWHRASHMFGSSLGRLWRSLYGLYCAVHGQCRIVWVAAACGIQFFWSGI